MSTKVQPTKSSRNSGKPIVISRLIWLLLTPLYLVNIVFGAFMTLPYWLFTGKYYYDSKYFKWVMNWLWSVHPNGL